MIEIKRWDNGEVIHSGKFNSIKECLKDGVSKGVSFFRANLRGADLGEADLGEADLGEADLEGADLERANLREADLKGADLKGADLEGADLEGAKGILVFKSQSSGRLFYFVSGDEIKVQAGCFWGSIRKLKEKIKRYHSEETHWDYLMACDWAERAWR